MPDMKTIADAVDTAARRLILRVWQHTNDLGISDFWDEFPGVDAERFRDIAARAAVLIDQWRPTGAEYDQAYRLLTSRAEEDQ